MRILPIIRPYFWPVDRRDLRVKIVLGMVVLLLSKIVTVAVPYFFKWVTDSLTTPDALAKTEWGALFPAIVMTPMALLAGYGLTRLGQVLLSQIRDVYFAEAGVHALRGLAYKTFEHMHNMSMRFHLDRRMGGLSRSIDRGVKAIDTLVRMMFANVIPTFVEIILMIGVLAYSFDFRYIVIIFGTVAVYIWFTLKASEWRIGIRKQMNESDSEANAKAMDSLINFETVKYFNNETLEAQRFDVAMAAYQKASVRTYVSLGWLNSGQTLIFTIGLVACMAMTMQGIASGKNTVGDMVMMNALMIQLWFPLNFLGFFYRELKQAAMDLGDMVELLHQTPEVKDAPDAQPLQLMHGAVSFKNVMFHYAPDREILKGISFDIPAGKTVAVVGASGAGKSTLSRILFRFYDISGGAVEVDGQDIRHVTQNTLRAHIGIVPQDTVLFNDSIRYNIRYGRPSASDAEIEQAAQMAQIDGFIKSLPQGYDTPVGERGLKLSGGEKQRVAIARTLLKNPEILILDEATSALDTNTEREIQSALKLISHNRTTLVIAHRLSTIVDADEILVMDAGHIIERGTHAQLLERNGVYANMWTRQNESAENSIDVS